jgi:hypothetical protein
MGAFVEMVDEMVGGIPIKKFFDEEMGLSDMDPDDFDSMPPFPFPAELFPMGTFPVGMKTTREILTGLPPSVLELIETGQSECSKLVQLQSAHGTGSDHM